MLQKSACTRSDKTGSRRQAVWVLELVEASTARILASEARMDSFWMFRAMASCTPRRRSVLCVKEAMAAGSPAGESRDEGYAWPGAAAR